MLLVLAKSLIDIYLRIIIRMAFPTKFFCFSWVHLVIRQEVNVSFMFHINILFYSIFKTNSIYSNIWLFEDFLRYLFFSKM